ncbi:MAG: helix-turn-helix domain-containing protein [Lachnospiraceae bacterium]
MFDNIRFITSYFNTKAAEDKAEDYENYFDEPDQKLSCSYTLIGRVDTILPPPLTDFALNNYFYIQGFGIFHVDSKYYTKRKNFNSYLIIYTYDGTGFLEYENKTYTLHAGDGFFIDCRKPHFYKTDGKNWLHSDLHINGSIIEKLYSDYASSGSCSFSEPLTGKYHTLLEQLITLKDSNVPYPELQMSNAISNILTFLVINSVTAKNRISVTSENMSYLIGYIENHYTKDLSLDFLASFAGISKFHLSREFHKYTGFSPYEYIIQLRIKRAQFLLMSTTLPATKIAQSVGIKDDNNFNNLFKKRVGTTPTYYRKHVTENGII